LKTIQLAGACCIGTVIGADSKNLSAPLACVSIVRRYGISRANKTLSMPSSNNQ
jgi:hypothetical protein